MLHHAPRTVHATLLSSLRPSPPSPSPFLPRAQRIHPLRARTASPRTHLPLSSPSSAPLHSTIPKLLLPHPTPTIPLALSTNPLCLHLPLRSPFPFPSHLSNVTTMHRITV
ncbi:hypothetical protein COCC4DRAFT_148704 [Bipolaris maydis ATCC 48331]|uniref:Uncharacterized protein n=2 Tax=Cochliobolus heterostrophus TaxID=5016 RepID=M2U7D4_COCH5|nr:uncharacterized protein COCC4DRAFT_148704 [Bipolaris maydis ATCC 48331]EMD94414.1 hypothetical protein COCHEDRAFT_1093852 [Bipolaris maydis C5]ENI01244.1 hypothetical protein COCC4DRAFT_148704 [Bipolaris maydis ATCC 48331]KAJ6209835.1 hypothetical protein PSV09DRAFT_1093852 [Bipolaris maydis]